MRGLKFYPLHVAKLILLMVVCLSIRVSAQDTTPESTASAQSSTFDIPPEIAGHEAEWPLGNHDYANTRAAVNSQINSSNVKNLGVAWTFDLKGVSGWGAAAGNALI